MNQSVIHTREQADCPVCHASGPLAHQRLRDKLFGAPGDWSLRRCAQPDCGTLWLDPQPLASDIGEAYRNYYTHSDEFVPTDNAIRRLSRAARGAYLARIYGYPQAGPAGPGAGFASRLLHLLPVVRSAADFSVMYLPFRPGGRVLDVGCGSGYLLSELRERGWSDVHGVDFDEAAVAHARSKGLDVHLGALEDAPLEEGSFDAITMSHCIEHLYEAPETLQRALALLKPGGQLVLVTPNVNSLGQSLFGRHWRGLEPPRHLQLYSPQGLRSLCERVGFSDSEVRTTIRGAGGLFAESIAIARAPEQPGTAAVGGIDRLLGRGLQLLEMLVHPFCRGRAEELVLVACRPGAENPAATGPL